MADTLYEALNISTEDNVIIPGTTPRLDFEINDTLMDMTVSARIDINQNGKTVIQALDTEIQGHHVAYTLSQEETYRLLPGVCQVQVHGLTSEELAWKTNIFQLTVGDTLSGTMIGLPS